MSAGAPLIHARGLVKQFGDLTAVDGVDFDVQRGEAFGFLGPNGAGKSSTMRMIGCVSPPTAGTLRILDLDPVHVSGHLFYVATRVAVAATIYLAAISAFGAVHSAWAILGVPLAVLIGLAFAAPISALSAWAETEVFNPLFRFGIMPMFLFSGTFFPVTRLPHGLREVAYATPLWHGVDEFRHLTLGTPSLGWSALHVGYLLLWAGVGVWVARRAYAKVLVK